MKVRKFASIVPIITTALLLTACNGGGDSNQSSSPPAVAMANTTSIAIQGLGNDIKVTNQPSVTIQGQADTDGQVNSVLYANLTNGSSGTATGTNQWSANIALAVGDNTLQFTANAASGEKVSVTTVVTYFPNLALATPLTLGVDVAYTGEATNAIITLGDSNTSSKSISLLSVDSSGKELGVIGTIADNGTLPDEIQGDGIFTGSANISSSSSGQQCFRAKVTPSGGDPYLSEVRCITITPHYTAAQVNTAVGFADAAEQQYAAALKAGKTQAEAATQVASALKSNADVGAAGSSNDGGVWWISQSGILGVYHPSLTANNQKALSASIANRQSNASLKLLNNSPKPVPTVSYPASYLRNRTSYSPQAINAKPNVKAMALAAGATSAENLVGSSRATLISPYINNPADTANSFGTNDDYYVPWISIQNGNQCQMYADKEAINNGTSSITLSDFKNLSTYGYIHISSHGDNFYNGLLSLWQDSWGPNNWLQGSLSQVAIYSGVYLPKSGNDYVFGDLESDAQAKRIAIAPGGAVVLLPGFFERYLPSLPNSLVVLSACRSAYNSSLANVFIAKGAGAVFGYSDYVATSYAQNTIKTVVDEMYNGKTVGEAYQAAIDKCGTNDSVNKCGAKNTTGAAYFKLFGAQTLKFGSGRFINLDFESGNSTPWMQDGDGRVISQLGVTKPSGGTYMGIISTGLGYATQSGSIKQKGCFSGKTKSLTFNWNFFSEEFKEYCGSQYQDAFSVIICETNGSTASNCQTLFTRKVDDLCSAVTKSDVSFDQGDVYNTGWGSATVDVSAWAGKKVQLEFYSTDVGDSIYDSAILLDDIQVQEAP